MKQNEVLKRQREQWKFLRMSKGITLDEVASFVKCHRTYINKWENAHINITDTKLEKYKEYITNK